ncbi:MAG: hypothetical protein ACYTGP_02230 [Planctomycetota bacterium]|jgi:hypothetical protein
MRFWTLLVTMTLAGCGGARVAPDAAPRPVGTLARPASAAYETPPILEASAILPAALLASDVHRVRAPVGTDGDLFHFTMESDFGLYTVESRAMLEVRVHEVKTLARVVDTNQADEFFDAMGTRLKQTADVPVRRLEDPVAMMEEVGEGVDKHLDRFGGMLESREKSVHEDPTVRELLIGMEKRTLAAELDLDVYSTNPKVQQCLNEIAWARASGKMVVDTAALAVPGGAGLALGATKFAGQVQDFLRDLSPAELHARNAVKLVAMGVDEDRVERFLGHRDLSPRHKTVMVASLEALEGVQGREVLLDAALGTDREAAALFHERRAVLLAQYHDRAEPLRQIEMRHGLPVATMRRAGILILLPVDAVCWSEETATALRNLARGDAPRRLVITGRLTERARREAAALGYAVREGFGVEETMTVIR